MRTTLEMVVKEEKLGWFGDWGEEHHTYKVSVTCDVCGKEYHGKREDTIYKHTPSIYTQETRFPVLRLKWGYGNHGFDCCETHPEVEIEAWVEKQKNMPVGGA